MSDLGIHSPQGAAHTQPGGGESVAQHWQWWASRNEEQYLVGPEDSREAVIQAGIEDFDGESFHIVEARKGSMAGYLPSGQRLIEWMTEGADDNGAFGEDDYCELTATPEAIEAAEADVEAVLADWFKRHSAIFPEPWAFAATRNGEWITMASLARVADSASPSHGGDEADAIGGVKPNQPTSTQEGVKP